MSAVKGVIKTLQDAMTPSDLLDPEQVGGKERVIIETYECASLASGSTIELPSLPKGAMVTDWVIDHDALGSGVTLKFGTYADDDCFYAAASCATADKKNMTDDGVAQAMGYRADDVTTDAEKTRLKLTTGGAAATGTIKVMVKYVAKA